MKYILMCLTALAVCLGCAWIPAGYIGRKRHLNKPAEIGLAIVIGLLLISGVTLGYLSVYYHADVSAGEDAESVQMQKIDGGYLFDGPGEDTALIFYPGAKVETLAYAPFLTSLAESGVDCFLADMPFRMAMFGSNRADRFLEKYSYEHWAAAGHSMGGLVISGYAAEHADQIEHVILLAAYPGGMIPDSITFCSIYGTEDGCLNREAYEKARTYWPADALEMIIEGGHMVLFGPHE